MLGHELLHYCFPWLLGRHPAQSCSLMDAVQRSSTWKGGKAAPCSGDPSAGTRALLHAQRAAVTLLLDCARSRVKPWWKKKQKLHLSSYLSLGILQPVELTQTQSQAHRLSPPSLFKGPSYVHTKNQSLQQKYWQQISPWSSLKQAAVIFIKLLIMDCGTKQFIKFPL